MPLLIWTRFVPPGPSSSIIILILSSSISSTSALHVPLYASFPSILLLHSVTLPATTPYKDMRNEQTSHFAEYPDIVLASRRRKLEVNGEAERWTLDVFLPRCKSGRREHGTGQLSGRGLFVPIQQKTS
ncbi:hypothetical protein BT69DRAFT_265676 [Atractiella rhizophila]|nr:hypothetical protein BT69DRAFT_265676 [Atractiella rhizophila]